MLDLTQISAKRSTDPSGSCCHTARSKQRIFVHEQGEHSLSLPQERPPPQEKRKGFGKDECFKEQAEGVVAAGTGPRSRRCSALSPSAAARDEFHGVTE